jgi:hypothetical protein
MSSQPFGIWFEELLIICGNLSENALAKVDYQIPKNHDAEHQKSDF